MKRILSAKLAVVLWLALLFSSFEIKAQPLPPPNPNFLLNTWSFEDTNWFSDAGYAPVSFTNLNNLPSFDGNGLQLDSTNAAWLNYNFIEASNSITNLTFNAGTIEMWVLPDWNSGTGPGDWGRLIDVGDYSTNTPSSWWSLYFNQDGSNLFFSSETNGVFTNYLSYPISWDTNTWHFVALTYNHFRSALYVDGQWATNGGGVFYLPPTNVTTFFVGSDNTGLAQSRVLIDDMATYNYAISAYVVTNDYEAGMELMGGGSHRDDSGPTLPGGGGGIGTNDYTGGSSYVAPDYGSNLWVATFGISNSVAGLLLSNTTPDILFEIQGRTNLAQGDWFSEGFVNGSELTNWTSASVYAGQNGNLFLRIRSWQDTTGTGIPDWWWLAYFGQTTNVNAYASAAGDGLSNLQKFQQGLNPTNYYHPQALAGFFGAVTATNAFLYWNPATNATGYLIQRGILNTNGTYAYTQIVVSSNATWFEDVGIITNANAQNNIYNLQAMFPGGAVSGTNSWEPLWFQNDGGDGPPYAPPLPNNVYAYADATGTNVVIAWAPATGAFVNQATNYIMRLGTNTGYPGDYNFSPIAQAGSNATSYTFNGLTNAASWENAYAVTAVYPGGGWSATVPASGYTIGLGNREGSAAPTNFVGYTDFGTNLFLAWDEVPGAVAYLVYGGNYDETLNFTHYQPLGPVTGTAFELPGGVDGDAIPLYSSFYVVAVFADGSLSQSAICFPVTDRALPAPTGLTAYVDATGTNIILHWDAVPGAIGYEIDRDDVGELATTDARTIYYFDTNAVNVLNDVYPEYGIVYTDYNYEVTAIMPYGVDSATATTSIADTPPAPATPGNFTATVDSTGTNVLLTWNSAGWAATGYTLWRGTYNASTGAYSYAQIGTASASATSFTDSAAATANATGNVTYQIAAEGMNSQFSTSATASLNASQFAHHGAVANNIIVSAQMVRNQTGHWQLMFSSIPTNVPTILVDWCFYEYFNDIGPDTGVLSFNDFVDQETVVSVSALTNGVYVIPDWLTTNNIPNNAYGILSFVRAVKTDGSISRPTQAGFLPYDAPCLVDGRQHLKQNLLFELRAATISQPGVSLTENNVYHNPLFEPLNIPTDTNYVESSFFHWSFMVKEDNDALPQYTKMDDLWPFTVNYELHQMLFDTNYTGPSSFVWQTNLVTIPAPAVLGIGDPYWIYQNSVSQFHSGGSGVIYTYPDYTTVGAYTNAGILYLPSGIHNLFGIPFAAAMVNEGGMDSHNGYSYPPETLAIGGSIPLTNADTFFNVSVFYSQTADPSLVITNYYFALVNTPGTALTGRSSPYQSAPLPCNLGFASTNQTQIMIASVGTPTVVGGWAKEKILNGSANKFAYLGQYYATNALVVTNGLITTNTTGIVSPYGDFFPLQPGQVAMVTMPDTDTGQQGTGIVDVISLNADANHDGTMDFAYNSPDFVSSSKPFRFWVNDNIDSGDFGGDGVPGAQPFYLQDGLNSSSGIIPALTPTGMAAGAFYRVHGRRDLVDYFPVYLNLGSLFQSNTLSAGISSTDTNYQFVLSQADGALRFVYTDLTPTNYMNFLQDTNESGNLATATAWPISAQGIPLNNVFNSSFMRNVATNNGGIILVEAATNTTQPLVLTIYHGTNQIAQTSLPLSISGVEQMFRHKNLLLNIPSAMPDRLTDADVPNEPDTINANFVFLHGYNVKPDEARGVQADMFKRMYWAGSHAKFYGVTWEGADTKIGNILTPNYHTNVVNAFATAPLLAAFISTLTNSGPVAASAHSLGNMVTLSAISDRNAPISQYFMLDAAVPVEAIDPASVNVPFMTYSTWTGYSNRLFAANWYQLFPTNDARSTLSWNNRLGNLRNVDVYNFYSSGEEVLRLTAGDPPLSTINILVTQVINRFSLIGLWPDVPFGTYTWYWQEKGKGTCNEDGLIGSSHGGWKFSSYWVDSSGNPLSPAIMNDTSNTNLQEYPMFKFNSTANLSLLTLDNDLTGGVEESDPSTYAAANRNRILSDAIPAMSLVIGANPVPAFSPPKSLIEKNIDMMTLKNGWSQARTYGEAGMWHHSDFAQMADTFTYQLFNQFVNTGNLK